MSAARVLFPSALVMYHTQPMVRHDPDTGVLVDAPAGQARDWHVRMWVSQLNAAARHVARMLRLPVLDWEALADSLTPAQYLYDNHHSWSWMVLEQLNIVLNMVEEYVKPQPSFKNSQPQY